MTNQATNSSALRAPLPSRGAAHTSSNPNTAVASSISFPAPTAAVVFRPHFPNVANSDINVNTSIYYNAPSANAFAAAYSAPRQSLSFSKPFSAFTYEVKKPIEEGKENQEEYNNNTAVATLAKFAAIKQAGLPALSAPEKKKLISSLNPNAKEFVLPKVPTPLPLSQTAEKVSDTQQNIKSPSSNCSADDGGFEKSKIKENISASSATEQKKEPCGNKHSTTAKNSQHVSAKYGQQPSILDLLLPILVFAVCLLPLLAWITVEERMNKLKTLAWITVEERIKDLKTLAWITVEERMMKKLKKLAWITVEERMMKKLKTLPSKVKRKVCKIKKTALYARSKALFYLRIAFFVLFAGLCGSIALVSASVLLLLHHVQPHPTFVVLVGLPASLMLVAGGFGAMCAVLVPMVPVLKRKIQNWKKNFSKISSAFGKKWKKVLLIFAAILVVAGIVWVVLGEYAVTVIPVAIMIAKDCYLSRKKVNFNTDRQRKFFIF